MMSIAAIQEIIKKHGVGSIVEFGYDDGGSLYFLEPEDVLDPNSFLKIGDVELIKVKGRFMNKKTGMRDIEGTVYRTVDDIRCITLVNDIKKKPDVDPLNVYTI